MQTKKQKAKFYVMEKSLRYMSEVYVEANDDRKVIPLNRQAFKIAFKRKNSKAVSKKQGTKGNLICGK